MISALIEAGFLFLTALGIMGGAALMVHRIEGGKTERMAMTEGTKQKMLDQAIFAEQNRQMDLQLKAAEHNQTVLALETPVVNPSCFTDFETSRQSSSGFPGPREVWEVIDPK